jgi:hypothetical protein
MRFIALVALAFVMIVTFAQAAVTLPESTTPATGKAAVDQLIPWLLDEDQQLRGVRFSKLILDTTGRKVLPFDANNAVDQRVAKMISAACDETMKRLNAPDSEIQNIDRINEVSSHFEDTLRALLNTTPGLQCDFPLTVEGKLQRSGYPDLRITDLDSKRVFYLDPKLYAAGSRDSSFRTFYFEPKKSTNKVRDDAVHFVVGFEHQPPLRSDSASAPREIGSGSPNEGGSASPLARRSSAEAANTIWKFTRWDLVDLSRFTVKLKAEFQGSNRDMYRKEAIVASSAK